jgi:hypothetical protein
MLYKEHVLIRCLEPNLHRRKNSSILGVIHIFVLEDIMYTAFDNGNSSTSKLRRRLFLGSVVRLSGRPVNTLISWATI